MNKKITWITRTALFTSLLIAMQSATAPLGNTIITGSIVNLILVISVMTCGLSTGLTVASISPVFAKLFGIGPFWALIPFIIMGNAVLSFTWYYLGAGNIQKGIPRVALTAVVAAAAKFGVLYAGVVKIAVPLILKLPEPQATMISAMFSLPQFLTALIGGGFAIFILPVLEKAVAKRA